ncbi:UNVERIFIED_CONTAM: hypothetical protein H355_005920 [Colinus virginianus]|nr:hypothetical protein H355_005920 [Colinus virginianus]
MAQILPIRFQEHLQAEGNYLTTKQTVTRKPMFQEWVIKVTVVSSFTVQFDVKHVCTAASSLALLLDRARLNARQVAFFNSTRIKIKLRHLTCGIKLEIVIDAKLKWSEIGLWKQS